MGLFEAGPALVGNTSLWVGKCAVWRRTKLGNKAATNQRFLEIHRDQLSRAGAGSQSIVSGLVQFVGAEQLPNEVAMLAVVDPSLHRQKR
jgi:hypothetical protein